MTTPQGEVPDFDSASDSERLIPDIPGVPHSEATREESGTLFDDPDEESDEDVLEEIERDTRKVLGIFGVEGANSAAHNEIIQLWHKMEMSQTLVADLALLTTTEIQKKSRDELAKPHFADLRERSEVLTNAYDIRRDLIEQIAPNLIKLGYRRLDAYRLPRSNKNDMAMAFRVEGWLLDQFFMQDLPEQIRAAVRAAPEQKMDRLTLFTMTMDEIVRQARIVDSEATREQYDLRFSSDVKAYRELRKTLKNAYKIADSTFSKLID